MKKINLFKRVTACVLVLLLAVPFTTTSLYSQENSVAQSNEALFRTEELDQMLAPIALYPDALLAQILTASTYPLEVVSAARFVQANEGLTGEALLAAAGDKDWDPSVKAMLEFPGILAMMDEQLEWTTRLGDAFLAQQRDVMDSVQRLRDKAYAQGNLTNTKEQVVKVERPTQIIIIEPVSPQVVYVPVYDPMVVYGTWWYPFYPPYHYYPRRYLGRVFLGGFFVRLVWVGWEIWFCDWHHHYVRIHVKRHNDFTRRHYKMSEHYQIKDDGKGEQVWKHDPQHRRNAGYRDSSTAQRFDGQEHPDSIAKPIAPNLRIGIGDPAVIDPKKGDVRKPGDVKQKTTDVRFVVEDPISAQPKRGDVKKPVYGIPINVDPEANTGDRTPVKNSNGNIRGGGEQKRDSLEPITADIRIGTSDQGDAKLSTRDLIFGAGTQHSQNLPGLYPGAGGPN